MFMADTRRNRRDFIKMLGLGAVSIAVSGCSGQLFTGGRQDKRLNFVFILIDDMGWTDVACYGSKFYETPNIDRLAAKGMRFTDAYASCPVCSPTRASIMTGKYPARLHLTDWITGWRYPYAKLNNPQWNKQLNLEEFTLAEALKSAGYATCFIGKWHLGGRAYFPEHQGFDVNIGGCHIGAPPSYFDPYMNKKKDLWGGGSIPTLKPGTPGEYLTDRLTDDSLKFIEANREKPFFLYLSHYAVHTPLQAKKHLISKYKAKVNTNPDYPQHHAVYAAMVESVDDSVGRIMAKLKELKIDDRTVVIFTSDNGGLIGEFQWREVTSNLPLRSGKGDAYEGGVREPMIVCWPGVVEQGSVCNEPVISTDFYPTILEMAGLPLRPRQHCDGVSLMPLLKKTGRLHREAIYWHYPHYHPCGATPYSAVRRGHWKLIEFFEDGRLELYNLKNDISEKNNLAGKMLRRTAELHRMLKAWRKETNTQLPTLNPDYDPKKHDQDNPQI
jgi:arylsulfatase A-like enzyme